MRREAGSRARYEEIAQDIAKRISQGDLMEGSRVLGRSSLAGTYQVSPETIRRAVAILHERGILQSVAGSGIRVLSRFAAMEYLEGLKTRSTLEEGAREIRTLLKQRRELDVKIETVLERLLSHATGALASRHVEELMIQEGSWALGRSLQETRLRSLTGATVVAVSRGDVDHFSPPVDLLLMAGDVLTVIGAESARARARAVLERQEPPEGI